MAKYEGDVRADRFESMIRSTEAKHAFNRKGSIQMCVRCKNTFEDYSKVCPVCDKRTMATVKPIPAKHLEEAQRNAHRRAKARLGL